jgi:hypothetical protein
MSYQSKAHLRILSDSKICDVRDLPVSTNLKTWTFEFESIFIQKSGAENWCPFEILLLFLQLYSIHFFLQSMSAEDEFIDYEEDDNNNQEGKDEEANELVKKWVARYAESNNL